MSENSSRISFKTVKMKRNIKLLTRVWRNKLRKTREFWWNKCITQNCITILWLKFRILWKYLYQHPNFIENYVHTKYTKRLSIKNTCSLLITSDNAIYVTCINEHKLIFKNINIWNFEKLFQLYIFLTQIMLTFKF